MKLNRQICIAVGLLTIGACIYILFRESVFFTLPFVDPNSPLPIIELPDNTLSHVLLYIVPDALWCTALMCYASTIKSPSMRVMAVCLAPLMELGQMTDIIPGTFDIADLVTYILIIIIFLQKWRRTEPKSPHCATAQCSSSSLL